MSCYHFWPLMAIHMRDRKYAYKYVKKYKNYIFKINFRIGFYSHVLIGIACLCHLMIKLSNVIDYNDL